MNNSYDAVIRLLIHLQTTCSCMSKSLHPHSKVRTSTQYTLSRPHYVKMLMGVKFQCPKWKKNLHAHGKLSCQEEGAPVCLVSMSQWSMAGTQELAADIRGGWGQDFLQPWTELTYLNLTFKLTFKLSTRCHHSHRHVKFKTANSKTAK